MNAQQLLIQKYGNPDKNYLNKWCIDWAVKKDFPWFPATKIYINKDFKLKLVQAFAALEKEGLEKEIITFDGCYNDRNTTGSNKKSLHAWAVATDLNQKTNLMVMHQVKNKYPLGGFTEKFVTVMKSTGLFWGGDYTTRFDPMHFSLYNG